MRFDWDETKEEANVLKHGFDFSIAPRLMRDPLSRLLDDQYEGGGRRFRAIGLVNDVCLVMVHSHPDPSDDEFIRVIGIRKATRLERKQYEDDCYPR